MDFDWQSRLRRASIVYYYHLQVSLHKHFQTNRLRLHGAMWPGRDGGGCREDGLPHHDRLRLVSSPRRRRRTTASNNCCVSFVCAEQIFYKSSAFLIL